MKSTRRPGLSAILSIPGLLVLLVSARSSAQAQYTLSPPNCGVLVPDSSCAFIYVKPSFVVKNLHPSVIRVSIWCATKIGEPNAWATMEMAAQATAARDASYSPAGTAQTRIGIPKSALSPGQVLTLTCELMLTRGNSDGTVVKALAVASATTPQTPTDTNWNEVATGSVVKWTQNLTFPSATTP